MLQTVLVCTQVAADAGDVVDSVLDDVDSRLRILGGQDVDIADAGGVALVVGVAHGLDVHVADLDLHLVELVGGVADLEVQSLSGGTGNSVLGSRDIAQSGLNALLRGQVLILQEGLRGGISGGRAIGVGGLHQGDAVLAGLGADGPDGIVGSGLGQPLGKDVHIDGAVGLLQIADIDLVGTDGPLVGIGVGEGNGLGADLELCAVHDLLILQLDHGAGQPVAILVNAVLDLDGLDVVVAAGTGGTGGSASDRSTGTQSGFHIGTGGSAAIRCVGDTCNRTIFAVLQSKVDLTISSCRDVIHILELNSVTVGIVSCGSLQRSNDIINGCRVLQICGGKGQRLIGTASAGGIRH